jgi:hypothetical protein
VQDADEMMDFYSLKHQKLISVPDSALRKRRIRRGPKSSPRGARFAVLADVVVDGTPVTVSRFIKRDAFDALDVPEVR